MAKAKEKKNEVVSWDAELAAAAEAAAAREKPTGGNMISTSSGVLKMGGATLPGNQLACIVLASRHVNALYATKYDPDNPASPTCFAIGEDDTALCPHAEADKAENKTCAGCPKNEWGSADTGKGKACKNLRRLALIPAGEFDKQGKFTRFETDDLASAELVFLSIPVTSVNGYKGYVNQLNAMLHRPPWSVITRVHVEPDAKTQFKLLFEHVDNLVEADLPTLKARRDEAEKAVDFAFAKPSDAPAAVAKAQPKAKRKY